MSERAAMKRRVRGLLHDKWLEALAAFLLAALPMLGTAGLAYILMQRLQAGATPLPAQLAELYRKAGGLSSFFLTVLYANTSLNLQHFISGLPGLALLLGVYLFVWLPISVSLSSYFIHLLRGKQPRVIEVFYCFSGRYPQILSGMLYRTLWLLIWMFAAFAAPVLLYMAGVSVIEAFAEQLSLYQIHILIGLVVLCVLWFVVFFILLINRVFAYILTPICIAAQPRLTPYRAVRLSRKLMRGNKGQLIALFLSFLKYMIPAILAGICLLLLPLLNRWLSLTDSASSLLQWISVILIAANMLVLFYVAPYTLACFHAFYIERKREALLDKEITQEDLASTTNNSGASQPANMIDDMTGDIEIVSSYSGELPADDEAGYEQANEFPHVSSGQRTQPFAQLEGARPFEQTGGQRRFPPHANPQPAGSSMADTGRHSRPAPQSDSYSPQEDSASLEQTGRRRRVSSQTGTFEPVNDDAPLEQTGRRRRVSGYTGSFAPVDDDAFEQTGRQKRARYSDDGPQNEQ